MPRKPTCERDDGADSGFGWFVCTAHMALAPSLIISYSYLVARPARHRPLPVPQISLASCAMADETAAWRGGQSGRGGTGRAWRCCWCSCSTRRWTGSAQKTADGLRRLPPGRRTLFHLGSS
jgi:hypothetical protein